MKIKNLDKLKSQRQQLDEAIRAIEVAQKQQRRKDETRKKVVLGGLLMAWMATEKAFATQVHQRLEKHLTRRIDRELFGLDVVGP